MAQTVQRRNSLADYEHLKIHVVNMIGITKNNKKIRGWSTSPEWVVRMIRMSGQDGSEYTHHTCTSGIFFSTCSYFSGNSRCSYCTLWQYWQFHRSYVRLYGFCTDD